MDGNVCAGLSAATDERKKKIYIEFSDATSVQQVVPFFEVSAVKMVSN